MAGFAMQYMGISDTCFCCGAGFVHSRPRADAGDPANAGAPANADDDDDANAGAPTHAIAE